MGTGAVRISIIIPVYREGDRINALIGDLRRLDRQEICEIIVVDGSPSRDTIGRIEDDTVVTLVSEKGRARQMNAGAAVACSDILLFLHADTSLPGNAVERILSVMADRRNAAGSFGIVFDSDRRAVRFLGFLATLRSRLTRTPLGDHAIFVRRQYFRGISGYRDIPIMEDIDIVRRLKRSGGEIHVLKERVRTSARRVEKEGLVFCALRNCILFLLYYLGVPPRRLKAHYPDSDLPALD